MKGRTEEFKMKKILAALLCCALLLCCCSAFAADYIIATDTAFRPFEYTDETGKLVGIDVEILAAIAADFIVYWIIL